VTRNRRERGEVTQVEVDVPQPIEVVLPGQDGDAPRAEVLETLFALVERNIVRIHDLVAMRTHDADTCSGLASDELAEEVGALMALAGARPPLLAPHEEPRQVVPTRTAAPPYVVVLSHTLDQDAVIEQMQRLGELRDLGVMTDQEFALHKSRLLDR
jgi:hypothetical protein